MNEHKATATPVDLFGKDHWSLMGYVIDACANGRAGIGALQRPKMRCNGHKRPLMASAVGWRSQYSTRLRGFFEFALRADPVAAASAGYQLLDHDDWDCLEDLEAAGFLEILSMVNGAVQLTPRGVDVAAFLIRHKAVGGQYASFVLAEAQVAAMPA